MKKQPFDHQAMKKFCTIVCALYSTTAFAQDNFANIKVLVNGGDKITNTHNVNISIKADKVAQMKISNYPDLRDGKWGVYAESFAWLFETTEGKKTFYAQFKSVDGVESKIFSDDIEIDKTPPSGISIKIVTENGFTNAADQNVTLKFTATDAQYMMVSNSKSYYAVKWRAYQPELTNWALEGDMDGKKSVFVKFRDAAGNETETIMTDITVDRTPPSGGEIRISGNQFFATDPERNVKLFITIKGGEKMMLSNKSTFDGAEWVDFNTLLKWKLDEGEGKKNVFVKFKDVAGNVSEVYSDEIMQDTKPPYDCTFTINNGEATTNQIDKLVNLQIFAKDAALMIISNSPDFHGARWVKYETAYKNWQLVGEDAKKLVFIQFKDEAGNLSPIVKASIQLAR